MKNPFKNMKLSGKRLIGAASLALVILLILIFSVPLMGADFSGELSTTDAVVGGWFTEIAGQGAYR